MKTATDYLTENNKYTDFNNIGTNIPYIGVGLFSYKNELNKRIESIMYKDIIDIAYDGHTLLVEVRNNKYPNQIQNITFNGWGVDLFKTITLSVDLYLKGCLNTKNNHSEVEIQS